VIAKHLGFQGLNGSSLRAISALLKYGLIDEANGDKMKVSPLAMAIIHPRNKDEKVAAIREAASKPPLFAEISNEWPDGVPSDQNLRSYLLRKNFAPDAIDRVIQSYRETMGLVTQESGGYDSAEILNKEPIMEPQTHHLHAASITTGKAIVGSPRLGTIVKRLSGRQIL
jgi:hypothetical protein